MKSSIHYPLFSILAFSALAQPPMPPAPPKIPTAAQTSMLRSNQLAALSRNAAVVATDAQPTNRNIFTNFINTASSCRDPQVCILQVAEDPRSPIWRDVLYFNPTNNLTNWIRSNCAPNSFYRVGNYGLNNPTNK